MSFTPLPGKIVAQVTVTEEDIFYALVYRQLPKDWRKFIEYLCDHLADALNEHVYDEIRYLYDAWMEQQQEECPHRRTTAVSYGGYHFEAGQVWDDLFEVTVCLDCGKQLEDEAPTNVDVGGESEEVLF